MRLAKAVMRGGAPLLQEGAELSEALITRLCAMGLDSVTIEDAGGDGSPHSSLPGPEFYMRRLTRLRHVFRDAQAPDASWTREVRAAVESYFIDGLTRAHARQGAGLPASARAPGK
jgi:hypothetical protein